MKYTGNYNLKKPDGTDVVNIQDLNDNADILDQKLKEVEGKANSAPANSVNDAAIGTRTPDQAQAPASPGTGTLTQLVGWLTNRIKTITGKTNWWDAPDTTLGGAKAHMDATAPHSGHETPSGAQAKVNAHATNKSNPHTVTKSQVGLGNVDNIKQASKTEFDAHLADTLYQVAGGTATALTLTISETLINGLPITFIASANNNGAATTINTKPLYKPNTTTAPTLIAGKAYTIWYNQSGDCFFIKASAEGTAVAENVLAGKTFSNDNDTGLVGTATIKSLGGRSVATGSGTSNASANLIVSGLAFKPSIILVQKQGDVALRNCRAIYVNKSNFNGSTWDTDFRVNSGGGTTDNSTTITSNGFTILAGDANASYYWIAFE